MACENCSIQSPEHSIAVDREGNCSACGRPVCVVYKPTPQARWDSYFLDICSAVASKSPCLSRQIGAILVRDKSIISTGYNGPARGFPHCNEDNVGENECPRKILGYKSGEGLEHCPASHAEMNCIANAARIGTNTHGSTLFMNSIIPCKFCAVILVNAGIEEVVVRELTPYHEMSISIFAEGGVSIRSFKF